MFAATFFDGVVVVTERIAENFARFKPIIIQNYPNLRMLPIPSQNLPIDKENTLVFIGGISKLRGALEMVQAFEYLDSALNVRLDLMGRFEPKNLESELQDLPGYDRIRFLGWLPWPVAWKRAQDAIAGMVLYHPAPNHIESQPNKLFEYMAAGLPVIASNFPLWKEIIEGNHCGLTVDPLKPEEIADAIEYLIMHPEERRKMGENGRRAVKEKYNWEREGEKLLWLYEEMLKR
jgi:glycosyltransferase involved in cell wall biosynthesis